MNVQRSGSHAVIHFDYAYLSSVTEKGEQVRMRTILDTSTGYGTGCVSNVKVEGDKYVISSAVPFFKELGYTISMQDGCDQGNGGCGHQVFVRWSRSRANLARGDNSRGSGAMEGWHNLQQRQIRAL